MGVFGSLRRPSYLERQANNLSQMILMWVDESFDLMFPGGESLFGGGAASLDGLTWVTGANTVEIVDRAEVDSDTFYGEELEFGIEVDLVHVGNTSFRGFFRIHRLGADGAPAALVATVLSRAVCVERTTLAPRPMPERERLLGHCVAEPAMSVPQSYGERPADAFLWTTAARGTDCDGLGHLNNTKYATYGQEALEFAVAFGAFDADPAVAALAQQPITSLHIDCKLSPAPASLSSTKAPTKDSSV